VSPGDVKWIAYIALKNKSDANQSGLRIKTILMNGNKITSKSKDTESGKKQRPGQ